MVPGLRSTVPATSIVSIPPATVTVAQLSKPAVELAAAPSGSALLPAGEYSAAAGNRMTLPALLASQVPLASAVTSVKPPRPQETVEYQVAMLPRSEGNGLPYAERLSKPATGVKADISVGPLREVFEQTDGVLYWFAEQKKVRAVNQKLDINLQIGNPLVKVNDQEQQLILAPYIKCGRTMVPLQFLADTLNVAIRYNPATGQLVISSIEF